MIKAQIIELFVAIKENMTSTGAKKLAFFSRIRRMFNFLKRFHFLKMFCEKKAVKLVYGH